MRSLVLALALFFPLAAHAQALDHPINDTGIVLCGKAVNNDVDCATTDPVGRPGGMR